ncbi:hypothetical protein D3C77_565520 [compost metagenome]
MRDFIEIPLHLDAESCTVDFGKLLDESVLQFFIVLENIAGRNQQLVGGPPIKGIRVLDNIDDGNLIIDTAFTCHDLYPFNGFNIK